MTTTCSVWLNENEFKTGDAGLELYLKGPGTAHEMKGKMNNYVMLAKHREAEFIGREINPSDVI